MHHFCIFGVEKSDVMPLVRIEIQENCDQEYLLKIRDLVMATVVEALQLPDHDINIRVLEFKPDLFVLKNPYVKLI